MESSAAPAISTASRSQPVKPTFVILVRRAGLSRPRVRAAAERSSPILTTEIIRGIKRYSIRAAGFCQNFFVPNWTYRIRMASLMAADSSCMVGIKRNRTESGMVICRPICILPSAVMHSLAVVDLMM